MIQRPIISRLTHASTYHGSRLSLAPSSEVFIQTELQRHHRRNSAASALLQNYRNFYKYLRARGYPDTFLSKQFRRSPGFARRHNVLFKTPSVSNTKDDGVSALILSYSPGAIQLTAGVLVDRNELLPTHLAKRRNVYAWLRGVLLCQRCVSSYWYVSVCRAWHLRVCGASCLPVWWFRRHFL